MSWWTNGRRSRFRLDADDRKAAEREALDLWRMAQAPTGGLTLADIWAAYREDLGERRAAQAMGHEGKAVLPHFGHLRPDQITVETCRKYATTRRAKGISDGSIWTELGRVRSACNWAVKRKLLDNSPHIARPSKPAPKDRWLSDAEISLLLAAKMAPHTRLAILVMLSTACRVTAALELTWDRVDLERGILDLRADATGPRKGRAVVPINAGLKAALSEARRAALTDHVIEWNGGPVRDIKTGFRAAVADAGLKDVTPHVLRHTAAVHLAAGGMPLNRISQFLGHSSTAVTERVYARFAPDHLREEAELLDFTRIRAVRT
ncbi:tyrosine-type recombinase/integrase [Paroceanicella profunda]|uniref:tyrosine-type recombinase/integrase n=1 Tax=Paroceanicella profunda TaxID=2579971 RepID=UPI003D2930CD